MGNSRSGGTPPGPPRDEGSSSSSAGREDAASGTPGGPAIPAPAGARRGGNETVKDATPLPKRGGPGEPGPRSSGPGREWGSTGPGNVTRPRSSTKQNGAAEEAPSAASSKNTASGSLSRDSDMTAGSPKGADTPMSERGSNGNSCSSSKKRKRSVTKSGNYIKKFKPVQGANAAGIDVSPDRVDKENTSSGLLANSNVSKVQPRKPIGVPLQSIAAESTLPGKARNRPTAPARQSCLPSLQSLPIAPVHHEEMRNTPGDSEPISVQKEDSASGNDKVMPSDETDGSSNLCVACGTPGTLRSCDGKGCQTGYHMSCLDLSLEYLSPGIWFCTSCTDKRFQFGLHSIVDGIESVWDIKEAEGMQNSKRYFVKYKNLAHVHNRWVPEGDIDVTPGGPHLLSLFNKRNHTEKAIWKEEWTKPHRLLRKRLLIPPKLAGDCFSSDIKYSYCALEWLVKWRGLGYDHATWELETLPCLCTPEADQLKKNYENRREAAKQSSILTKAKVKQSSFQKLQKLPDGCHPDFDNDHLCSINHLREFWYESRGAVLVDDKEFVKKTVLFTMSVLTDVSQPILIVTTPASISLWEVQFNTLAPFINVVVYDGGKDKLKLIQDLEFYESGSCIMLQVLLSHADAILEDLEPIACINWEAVIVDYYQKSTLQYLDQLKQLSTDFRMLLVSSPIKDNLPEYVKLLGFLNPGEQENGNCVDNAEALVMSKKNFKDHVAYERRADSSKILEYWVPAYISQLQLEIYCSILLSNSSVLQSKMRSDSSLSDIMMSLSKCCDHPYLVDEFLQNSPVDNHNCTETIDTKVQACGKLLLLQEMLKEIRNKRLRVIILFQSGVSGGNSVGDILEGVVREKFGRDSYERVEKGAPFAKKHAAVRMFNDKAKGRFVFLIESRACVPSIELSSVDAIIIYNSDCNPLNDLEVLQRIKIESKFKYPSIFRLYTPFTLDEKQLLLAKHGLLIDNYKDMPHCLGHSLISWGASFLFTRLSELQHGNYASKSFEGDTYSMDKVILEFLKKLATNVEESTKIISKANMSGEFYSRNITLIGENVAMPALDGDPSIFWSSLLDGKSNCWSNISKPPQSSPRMLQNVEEPAKVPAEEADEVRRKRRKVDGITVPSSKRSSDSSNEDMFPKICTTLSPPLQQLDNTPPKKGVKTLMSTPKNLHVQLKQELSKLIKVLQLPDPVILMSEHFLEYVLKNHQVVTEPVGLLHPFMIALCWRAASFLNCEVDLRELLALLEKNLNWECSEDLVTFFYKRLRTLEKEIRDIAEETSTGQPVSAEDTQLLCEETSTNLENDHMFQNKEMNLDGMFTNGASHAISTVAEQMISERQEPVQETLRECHVPNAEVPNMIVKKSIDLVDNVFSLREKNILCKQQLEISGLVTHRQNNVIRLKNVCSLVLEHIRRSQIDEMTRIEKIKLSAQWFTMLMYAFLEHMKLQHDKLEGLQSDTWSLERQLKEKLHQVAKSGQLDRDFDRHITLPDSNFVMEEFIHFKEQNDEYLYQEPSTSECRNTEHIEIDNIAKPSMLLGGATSLVRGVHANNDGILDTDGVHLESPNSASSESLVTLVGTQAVLSCTSPQQSTDVSAQQNVAPSRCPPAEAEHAGLSGTHPVQVLQPEMQPSILLSDGPPQKTHPDDRSQTGCQPDRATGLSQGGTATSHPLGDFRMQVQEKYDGNAAADPVLLESPAYPADSPVTLQVSTEVESQICVPSMAAKQSTSPPAQQSLAILQHPPAEAEPSSISGTVAAWDLQPEVQPSTSMQDESAQAEDEHEVENEPVCMVTAHDLQSEIQPSTSVPAEQSTGLLAQQSLATSQHPPAEAKQADILGTQPACDLQPEVQASTSVQDEPAEAEDEPAEVEDEPEVPDVEDESEAEDEAAKAERAGTLGAIAAQDLHPEMQSSTSTQDVPFERTYMSGMPVLESPAIHRSVEPSLDPHAGVESAGMVTAHDLRSEILPSASVRTEQTTSPPAQLCSATSGHSPAEAEPADILGTEAACHLQPSQGEVQPLTTMQDQPAEEQACILGAISARNLQPETQPSTSTQSAPFERTYLVGTPVLQSPTLHHSVEPSLDPYARAESTHTLGLLTARDLQSEVQPSASTQDQPAEAEGAVMLGSTAAQDLQTELQSSTGVQQVPLEGTHSEERGQIGFQPNMVPGPEQPTQHPPVTTLALNSPRVSDEPLKNELNRLMHCNNLLSKDHEHKKALLLIEYNKEIEKIQMKYDSLLQKEDSAYVQTKKELAGIYTKVFVNKTLAEKFQEVFTPSSAAPGRSTAAIPAQPFESFSPAQNAASPVISLSAIRAPVRNQPGSHVRPSSVAQPSSPSWDAQQQAIVHGNFYGMPSSAFVPAPVPYGSYGSTGAQPRAVQPLSALASNLYRTMSPVPPPHMPHGSYRPAGTQLRDLQQFRMPPPYAVHSGQQQLPASRAVTSLGQYAPVIMGSNASTVPQGGVVLNSMDPSSAQQTMLPSASSSRPPLRASSLPPGRQESRANFLPSSSSIPIFMPVHRQSAYQNTVFGGTSGPQNAVRGSHQHAGAQIAGNQSGYESASLTAHLPARFGLGSSSSPAGTRAASPEVVCLSDDEW